METTLHFATRCMVQLLEMHKTEFVPVLFLLFSKKRTYYKGP